MANRSCKHWYRTLFRSIDGRPGYRREQLVLEFLLGDDLDRYMALRALKGNKNDS